MKTEEGGSNVSIAGSLPIDFQTTPVTLVEVVSLADEFNVSFPAIRGVQAGREYYVAMCPLETVIKLIRLDSDNSNRVPANFRAQRILNKARIPAISRYMVKNPDTYAFSSLTISVDSKVTFTPTSKSGPASKLGILTIPLEATFLINDGQHRRAAIEDAVKECPKLRFESISVVIYIDRGLKRSQQLFSDLNRYVVRPTPSLSILYDHRDPMARVVHNVVESVTVFRGMTETAKSTISNRSRKLFTLSSIYHATRELIDVGEDGAISEQAEQLVIEFWNEAAKNMRDWRLAASGGVAPCELRRDFVHAHGIALRALSRVGVDLLGRSPRGWKTRLRGLQKIDWSRSKAKVWEGRAMIGGKISKAHNNIVLTGNLIKKALGVPLNPKEEQVEMLYTRGKI